MKLLVFAHVPPPHHGQSYMVELMLSGFGGNRRKHRRANGVSPHGIECYHVDARLSKNLEDIGDFRPNKFLLLLFYCLQAIWCRFRYGVSTFYYIPAPGKRSALYRDWMVMFICRPFFKRVILHWHAAGLAKWLETVVRIQSRSITYDRLKNVDLSVVLSKYNRADAEKLLPQQIKVVSNGIPDPCPQFDRDVLPRRKARIEARAKLMAGEPLTDQELKQAGGDPQLVRVLYVAHCTHEKGLFDAVSGVLRASNKLAEQRSPLSVQLLVAGTFVRSEEKAEFDRMVAQAGAAQIIRYLGFVSGEQKLQALRDADLFCFPTYYENENQPVNLIEAMAFGLPILTTRWRSLPELFPANYPGLVSIRSPEQVADALLGLMTRQNSEAFRQIFLHDFTLESYLTGLANAFRSVERSGEVAASPAAASTLPRSS